MTNESAGGATLDAKIATATLWTLVLGGLGVLASAMQMLGYVEAGVPGWFNLLIALSACGLSLTLSRRSLTLTGILLAIFVAILADTLVATGIVLEERGLAPTILLVVRYMIMLAAARAVGQVFAGIFVERRDARNRGALQSDATTAPPAMLDPGKSPSAIYFFSFAGLLLVAAVIYALVIPLEDMGAVIFGGMIVMAGVVGAAALAESRYVPSLVQSLQEAVAAGDADQARSIRDRLVQMRGRGARALAAAALAFDAGAHDQARRAAFASDALNDIAKIGSLDRDAASAVRARFLATPAGAGPGSETRTAAAAALKAAGYTLTE